MFRHLGDAIRARRRAIGSTQEKTALTAGIHPRYLTRVEQGRVNPTAGTLWRLARALETTLSDLVDGI